MIGIISLLMLAVWLLILLYTASDRSISDASDFIEARFRNPKEPLVPYKRWQARPVPDDGDSVEIVRPLTESLEQIRQRIKNLMAKLDQLDHKEIKEVKDMIQRKVSIMQFKKQEHSESKHLAEDLEGNNSENRNDGVEHDTKDREALSSLAESLENVEKEKFRIDRSRQEKELAERYLMNGTIFEKEDSKYDNTVAKDGEGDEVELPSAAGVEEDINEELPDAVEVENNEKTVTSKVAAKDEDVKGNLVIATTKDFKTPATILTTMKEKNSPKPDEDEFKDNEGEDVDVDVDAGGHVDDTEPKQVESPLGIMAKRKHSGVNRRRTEIERSNRERNAEEDSSEAAREIKGQVDGSDSVLRNAELEKNKTQVKQKGIILQGTGDKTSINKANTNTQGEDMEDKETHRNTMNIKDSEEQNQTSAKLNKRNGHSEKKIQRRMNKKFRQLKQVKSRNRKRKQGYYLKFKKSIQG